MLVRQVFDPKLAQFSYIVGCPRSGEALVIDPERDVDRYYEVAARNRLRLVAGVDTHIHADYLSGLRELAERGLTVYASKEGGRDWQYEWLLNSDYRHRLLADGDAFSVGFIEFHAVHTPGHTPEHLSYLVKDAGSGARDYIALASGDFIFVGDVGRPDLLETAAGAIGTMLPAARAQYTSIQQQFRNLPEFLQVWPAHGAGSACGKSLGDVPISTVGYELRTNRSIMAASSEETFVRFILAGQPEPPAYFARMKRDNRIGPKPLASLPSPETLEPARVAGLGGRLDTAILDTRSRDRFFSGHIRGSILAELDYQFCTVAGSYVEEDTPIYLVADEQRVEEAVRALVRVGLDRVVGYVSPDALEEYGRGDGALVRTELTDMSGMEARRRAGGIRILDVRGQAEFDSGHVPGAINIAHTRVGLRLGELPKDQPLLVHCNSGARSAAAVSLLERHGYQAVQVNDLISNYRQAELQTGVTA
jgi:hydroxyacylglutathione hydrolase